MHPVREELFVKRLALTAAAASAVVLGLAAPASAAPSYDPNVARVANPANVCKSIPGTIQYDAGVLQMPAPDLSSFSYSSCVSTLAQGKAVVEPVEVFGDPYAQCDALVAGGVFSYPATLHSGEGGPEDQLLPDLTVNNRKECGNALYAYHYIADTLFGPEG